MKLYRVTGDRRLLDLAEFFLDGRGKPSASRDKTWGPYSQDHQPVTEQSEAVGHAVRAGYMYAAMADVAALTGNRAYREAVGRLWEDIVRRKMYVTGGVGARHAGEAFGDAYELPNLTAYNETCAAIAQCYFNHRMFLLHGDAKYMDVLERVLYNGMLSGVSYDGERFFYPNPLASNGAYERRPWFDCSCCPTNVCRFVPAIPGYAYAVRDRDVYVNLFVEGSGRLSMGDDECVIDQETAYPWDGEIAIRLAKAPADGRFRLRVRIPGWARNEAMPGGLYKFSKDSAKTATFAVGDGAARSVEDTIDSNGYLTIERGWREGDTLRLRLPMPIRRVVADERIVDDLGRVALQRGPLVYCVEDADQPDDKASQLIVSDEADFELGENSDLCGGVTTIQWRNPGSRQKNTAIPYFAWAHREPGEMAVWMRRAPGADEAVAP